MGRHSSPTQSGFLGGEWSPFSQGRLDLPLRKQALALSQNSVIYENGCWGRRSGVLHSGFTNRGLPNSRVFFYLSQAEDVTAVELTWDGTYSWLRLWCGSNLVTDSTKTVSAWSVGPPAEFTISTAATWVTGDDVIFNSPATNSSLNGANLFNNVYTLTKVDTTHFTVADAVLGTTFAYTAVNFTNTVSRVYKVKLPYLVAGDIQEIKAFVSSASTGISNQGQLILTHWQYPPFVIALLADNIPPTTNTYTTGALSLNDGPYNNYQEVGGAATVTQIMSGGVGAGASVTFAYDHSQGYINPNVGNAGAPSGSPGFNSSSTLNNGLVTTGDVGRAIRVVSEPAQWNSGSAYVLQNVVTRGVYPNSTYWTCTVAAATTGSAPETDPNEWQPSATGAWWGWMVITAVTNAYTCTATVQAGPGGRGLDPTNYTNIVFWETDHYNYYWGYPGTGLYYSGRLFLSAPGQIQGRFDASKSQPLQLRSQNFGSQFACWFSPTAQDGTVGDANAFSQTISSESPGLISWMASDVQGIVVGMSRDQWLLQSSAQGEVLTPTTVQAKRVGSLGSAAPTFITTLGPVRANTTLMFADHSQKRIFEFISDTFSARFTARQLSEHTSHMLLNRVQRIEYTDAPVPQGWVLDTAGALWSFTYRRVGFYSSQPPDINAWSRHALGASWTVTDMASMQEGFASGYPGVNGTTYNDTLILGMNDASGTYGHIGVMGTPVNESITGVNGKFLDHAPAQVIGRDPALDSSTAEIVLYGLSHLIGVSVRAFINGLDCGAYTVSGSGTITVPYGSDPEGL